MNVDRLELRRIALATMIMVTSVVHRSCSRGLTHARAKHAPLQNKYSVLEHMALRANFRGQYLEKSHGDHIHTSTCTFRYAYGLLDFQVSAYVVKISLNASARRAADFRRIWMTTRVKLFGSLRFRDYAYFTRKWSYAQSLSDRKS